jgi:hypothetical protein
MPEQAHESSKQHLGEHFGAGIGSLCNHGDRQHCQYRYGCMATTQKDRDSSNACCRS